jgi:hypothetical protein
VSFCPACQSEYREGFSRCADCDVELVAELPPSPSHAPAGADGWSQVFRGDPRSAEILRSILGTAGVKTVAPDEMIPQIRPYAPSTGGQVRILVATADLPKVREILRDDPLAHVSENEEELLRFPCPCGQTLETPLQTAGAEMKCPYCERTLTVPEIPKEFTPEAKAAPGKSGGRGFYVVTVHSPDGTLHHYCTLLSPDLISSKESLIPEVVIGSFRDRSGEVPTEFLPEGFLPNPKFVQVLHEFLVETVPQQAGFVAEAVQGGGEGWVYLFDQRTPDPTGDVPLEDILGGFEFKGGGLAGYSPNQSHLLYSQRGLFDLRAGLNAAFLKYLTVLQEKRRPA